MNFDNFFMKENYDKAQVYTNSKLANILFTRQLAKKLKGRWCGGDFEWILLQMVSLIDFELFKLILGCMHLCQQERMCKFSPFTLVQSTAILLGIWWAMLWTTTWCPCSTRRAWRAPRPQSTAPLKPFRTLACTSGKWYHWKRMVLLWSTAKLLGKKYNLSLCCSSLQSLGKRISYNITRYSTLRMVIEWLSTIKTSIYL